VRTGHWSQLALDGSEHGPARANLNAVSPQPEQSLVWFPHCEGVTRAGRVTGFRAEHAVSWLSRDDAFTGQPVHYRCGELRSLSLRHPARPLFEAAAAAFSPHSPVEVNTGNEDRGPLLLTMGGKDRTVPEAITKFTVKQYRHSDAVTDLVEFADRGHSLTVDSGWREVAEACLGWLTKQGL